MAGRIRITGLGIHNFRSLGALQVASLGELTALVGPNGAGKSNFADGLQFMNDVVRLGLSSALELRQGFAAVRRWSEGPPHDVSIATSVSGEKANGFYQFGLVGTGTEGSKVLWERAGWGPNEFEVINGRLTKAPKDFAPHVDPANLLLPLVATDPRFLPLASALRNIAVYSIFPQELREPQKPDRSRPMERHGKNWCSVLRDLDGQPEKDELIAALHKLTGDIVDVKVETHAGYQFALFRHETSDGGAKEKWLNAGQESDGTLRVAGILTALLQKTRMTLIGIEDPELTVHPGAVALIADFLKEASKRSQVLITTHSPDLLDCLDANQVRVVGKAEGTTTIDSLEAQQKESVKKRLMTLGELVRVEGLRPEPG